MWSSVFCGPIFLLSHDLIQSKRSVENLSCLRDVYQFAEASSLAIHETAFARFKRPLLDVGAKQFPPKKWFDVRTTTPKTEAILSEVYSCSARGRHLIRYAGFFIFFLELNVVSELRLACEWVVGVYLLSLGVV